MWVPHPELIWEGAVLQENYTEGDKFVQLLTESNVRKEITLKTVQDLPPLRNPAILIGQDDLTALSYLHEPGVLHNLEVRYVITATECKYSVTQCCIITSKRCNAIQYHFRFFFLFIYFRFLFCCNRFCGRQAIYTYCGIVLVAINPYAELQLYGPDIIRTYRGQANQGLEPHIFAVAEEAYAKLEREKCDLSIIVSGESGAYGKTNIEIVKLQETDI